MLEILNTIKSRMNSLGLSYEFGRMTQTPLSYPYWVGEYTEIEGLNEDGKEESTIILTGFSRGKFLELEKEKSIIKEHFRDGVLYYSEKGSTIYITYARAIPIPQEDDDLKKIQVILNIKYWKGN